MTNDDESNEDRIQRALNESKKRELEEKYGMDFSKGESKAPPEIEEQWLNYIDQFEQQFEHAKAITVREFIGNPSVMPLSEIPPEKLDEELERLVELMLEHEVILDFLAPTPLEEKYRFITEEFLDEEISDMRIPGMHHRYIYEEFHPNDELDIQDTTRHFLGFFLDREPEFFKHHFAKTDLCNGNGQPATLDQVMGQINCFYESVLVFVDVAVENIRCSIEGDVATSEADVAWQGLAADGIKEISHSGVAKLQLKKSEYGGWDVTQFRVPGFEW